MDTLQRAVTAVAITGPDAIADLASDIYEKLLAKANAMRLPAMDLAQRAEMFGEHSAALKEVLRNYIREARTALAAPVR
jgi:hypothetical protein